MVAQIVYVIGGVTVIALYHLELIAGRAFDGARRGSIGIEDGPQRIHPGIIFIFAALLDKHPVIRNGIRIRQTFDGKAAVLVFGRGESVILKDADFGGRYRRRFRRCGQLKITDHIIGRIYSILFKRPTRNLRELADGGTIFCEGQLSFRQRSGVGVGANRSDKGIASQVRYSQGIGGLIDKSEGGGVVGRKDITDGDGGRVCRLIRINAQCFVSNCISIFCVISLIIFTKSTITTTIKQEYCCISS